MGGKERVKRSGVKCIGREGEEASVDHFYFNRAQLLVVTSSGVSVLSAIQ
jgi:hypothetical protein